MEAALEQKPLEMCELSANRTEANVWSSVPASALNSHCHATSNPQEPLGTSQRQHLGGRSEQPPGGGAELSKLYCPLLPWRASPHSRRFFLNRCSGVNEWGLGRKHHLVLGCVTESLYKKPQVLLLQRFTV